MIITAAKRTYNLKHRARWIGRMNDDGARTAQALHRDASQRRVEPTRTAEEPKGLRGSST